MMAGLVALRCRSVPLMLAAFLVVNAPATELVPRGIADLVIIGVVKALFFAPHGPV